MFIIAATTFSTTAWAEITDELGIETLKAVRFAATSKASIKPGCRPENPLSSNPAYKRLCPKLELIPDSIIESTALPYVKRYVSEDTARQAIAFWSSTRGQTLQDKMLREIETGTYKQLNAEDLEVLNSANQTEYGRTLRQFSSDKAQTSAVIKVMLNYEPSQVSPLK